MYFFPQCMIDCWSLQAVVMYHASLMEGRELLPAVIAMWNLHVWRKLSEYAGYKHWEGLLPACCTCGHLGKAGCGTWWSNQKGFSYTLLASRLRKQSELKICSWSRATSAIFPSRFRSKPCGVQCHLLLSR